MFKKVIEPRFNETDALGHINNNVYSIWFDSSRESIYKEFTTTNNVNGIELIIAKISCEFLDEVFYGKEVEINTSINKIGNSSFEVIHKLYQDEKLCSIGYCTLVHFNHKEKKSVLISGKKREFLEKHLVKED